MSRDALYELVSVIAVNQLNMPAGAVYAANAVDNPTQRPFVVIRWEGNAKAFKNVGQQTVSIWVHDNLGDYARINSAIDALREQLPEYVHISGTDGHTITCIEWQGDSGELYDDGYQTVTRNSSFRVVSRLS